MARHSKYSHKLPGLLPFGRRAEWFVVNDHIFYVMRRGYSEQYRRFYFKDIQAILMRKTKGHVIWCSVLIVLGLIVAGLFVYGNSPIAALVFLAIFLIPALISLGYGPTCQLYVATGVQKEKIQAVTRWRRGLAAIAELKPLIVDAQGEVTEEQEAELRTVTARQIQNAAEASFKKQRPKWLKSAAETKAKPVLPTTNYRGSFHVAMVGGTLLFGLLCGIGVLMNHGMLTIAQIACFLALFALCITAIVKQRRSRLPSLLRKASWAGLVNFVLVAFVAWIYYTTLSIQEAFNFDSSGNLWQSHLEQTPMDNAVLMSVNGVGIIGAIVVSLVGVIGLSRWWKQKDSSPPPPPPMPGSFES